VSTSSDQRDNAVASALGWSALSLLGGWAAVGLLDGGVRVVDAWRLHVAMRPGGHWTAESVMPIGADLLLGLLWMAAMGALALCAAVGAAALLLRAQIVRAAVLLVVVVAGGAAQYVFVVLTASAGWSFAETDRIDGNLFAAAGALVAPVLVAVAVWEALRPVLRAPRSTPEHAAAA